MKNKIVLLGFAAVLLTGTSCTSHYQLAGVERTRVLMDKTYDNPSVPATVSFLAPYKVEVDKQMSPVVGRVANYMYAKKPESPLSNLLTEVLMWAGKTYQETPDFAVYNIGGMRAALAVGDVTIGDVLDVAPFENKICFVTLTGQKVKELFQQIAAQGGQGVSKDVRLVITKDGQLKSALVHGKEIDENADYRIVTLDYVAQGNDHMAAFLSGKNINNPKAESNNIRFIIMDYLRERMAAGETVRSEMDGRITIE